MQALRWLTLVVLLCTMAAVGCGGGGGGSSSTNTTGTPITATTTLTGALELPATLNHQLLASIDLASSTDSVVRNKFLTTGTRQAFINNTGVAYPVTVDPATLSFRIDGVPEAGTYNLDIRVGKLRWLAQVSGSTGIVLNSRSTAAALLAATPALSQAQRTAAVLLASYPAQITGLAQYLDTLFVVDPVNTPNDILGTQTLTTTVTNLAALIASNPIAVPGAQLAYLNLGNNDLNGDGRADFRVERGNSGISYHVEPLLDSRMVQATGSVGNLSFVSDADLVRFTPTQGLYSWILSTDINIGLWARLTYGRTADTFIRVWVKRIDSLDGVFYGMPIEYQLVNGTGTAIATGTKVFRKFGLTPGLNEVEASDFINDGTASSPQMLIYGANGLGSPYQQTALVRFREAVNTLSISRATTYSTGSADGYHLNTSAALSAVNPSYSLQVGQVFDAYFPALGNYALFQIKEIDATRFTITVDYKINRAYNDPSF